MRKYLTAVCTIIKSTKFLFLILCFLFHIGVNAQKQVDRKNNQVNHDSSLINLWAHKIIDDSELSNANIGISIYDPATKKYLYNYNGNKYFIPASNTKIITCFAAMKYLGDSLVGARYIQMGNGVYIMLATGDPTFLHPDFTSHPVFNFMNSVKRPVTISTTNWQDNSFGMGWSWDDFNADYMAERSAFPIYGNTVSFHLENYTFDSSSTLQYSFKCRPAFFEKKIQFSIDPASYIHKENGIKYSPDFISLERKMACNEFVILPSQNTFEDITIPFFAGDKQLIETLLKDTLKKEISLTNDAYNFSNYKSIPIPSQPTDSMLKIMMHRSDNFYAEQSLLMVSNEKLSVMNDEKIIDTLLKNDFKDIPQKPQWMDGSGLSRYNLFTPQDFIYILNKMRNEFSWNRITTIFPTAGMGTLSNLPKNMIGKIYAKTGTLSNNIALSGFIITNKNKLLIFSVMVGNHVSKASKIRKSVYQFVTSIVNEY